MSKVEECFTFLISCDIDLPIQVRLINFTKASGSSKRHSNVDDIIRERQNNNSHASTIQVVARICDHGKTLGLEMVSHYYDCTSNLCPMNEKLTFCVKYRDLSESAQLALTVWELVEAGGRRLVGGTTMRLFSKKGRLKTSDQKLNVWPGKEADQQWPTVTPGKAPVAKRGELGRLEYLLKCYTRGDIPRIDWLDRMALKEIQKKQKSLSCDSNFAQLLIKLPVFPHCILYQSPQSNMHHAQPLKPTVLPDVDDIISGILMIQDPESGMENLIENKAAKKEKNMDRLKLDRNIKPDVKQREKIHNILKMPPNKPILNEDKQLLWKFRGSLVSEKIPTALTKFLKCVDWSDDREAREAAELMDQWTQIDIPDALELLSPDFKNSRVRAHAISVLETADDEELMFYLLQLVQALRYEVETESKLAEFLARRAAQNPQLGFFFHWFLFPDWNDSDFSSRILAVHQLFRKNLEGLPHGRMVWENIILQMNFVAQVSHISKELKQSWKHKKKEHLREMLSEHGSVSELRTMHVPLPLDPNILLTGILPQDCSVYRSARSPLKLVFKTEHNFLESFNFMHPPANQSSRVMQSDISHSVQSNLTSCLENEKEKTITLIYKKGDDLRQDQFTVSMFALMDSLLKKENLDLKLTIYRVLPTSADDGFVEFVESCALAKILNDHRTIHAFLAIENYDLYGPFGIKQEVLNTFVKSCAGYCVMTYIMGVGDRHLDNLMLTTDGHLFHIDFGFILGKDPKPFPPPMKLCKEMVEAMGGTSSEHYNNFLTYCCEAYNIIRKSAHLILSLFHLMAESSIPDISCDPEKAILKIQDRLDLDMDDETVIQRMQHLINESASALMPQIMETTHRWAQYWR